MYKQELDQWLRIADDKYWLSNERRSVHEEKRNENDGQIGNLSMRFSELMENMNSTEREVTNIERMKNAETCKIHTISHLEQQLCTLSLFSGREKEFEDLMAKYVQELIGSMVLSNLSFGIDKLDEVFSCLLNWNGRKRNEWPGSVSYQRGVLSKMIEIVKAKNQDMRIAYFGKLQELTNKFSQALDACKNDTI